MVDKLFDIGAKIVVINDKLIRIEDFYFVVIDENDTYAEIIEGDDKGEIIPLVNVMPDCSYYILPGFYRNLMENSKSVNDESTMNELLNYFKREYNGKIYNFENGKLYETQEESENDFGNLNVVKLCELVKEKIINQDELVKKVVTSIVYNQKLIESDLSDDDIRLLKKVLLVMGKTGTGKTEVMKQVSNLLDIPYVIEDATKFTMDGYVGRSVSDMLVDLYRAADYDLYKAETGLLIIDEIDKKSKTSELSPASSTGVQTSLLKMLEGEKMKITIDKGVQKEEIEFDTSLLTIFLMGAFSGIEKKVNRVIGFNAEEKVIEEYTSDDLTNYGLIPELVGRISSIVKTKDLELNDFKDIITKSSISSLKLQEKFYSSLGITLKFDDDFIEKLAILAKEKNIGARGIKKAFDEMFSDYDFEALNNGFSELSFENGKVLKRKHNSIEKTIDL